MMLTENLLGAVRRARVPRFVLASSFSVYDYDRLSRRDLLVEDKALVEDRTGVDYYALSKRIQEELVVNGAAEGYFSAAVVRPGAVYSRERYWTPRIGHAISDRHWLLIGGSATLPLIHVCDCATALVKAAEVPNRLNFIVNVVENDLPTQAQYVKSLRQSVVPNTRISRVPLWIPKFAALCTHVINQTLFNGTAPMPQLLKGPMLNARFKPLRFSNALAATTLSWTPKRSVRSVFHKPAKETSRISQAPDTV
jgi:nucleoside-diphosphate-sugar epimerase